MKKSIAIFLVVTIAINVLGFGFMNVRASAVVAVDDILFAIIGGMIVGVISSITASIASHPYEMGQVEINKISHLNDIAQNMGEIIQIDALEMLDGSISYSFSPVEGLTGDDADFASIFCEKLNAYDNIDMLIRGYKDYYESNGFTAGYSHVEARKYAEFKEDVVNSFLSYLASKNYWENFTKGTQVMAEQGLVPEVNFDWKTGGIPLKIPGNRNYVDTSKDGFQFTIPYRIERSNGYINKESAIISDSIKNISFKGSDENGYRAIASVYSDNMSGFGTYVIYNNDIYYDFYIATSSRYDITYTNSINDSKIGNYYNSAGECLKDKTNTLVGLYGGIYIRENGITDEYPVNSISEDDLIETNAGVDIEFPLTDEEETIAEAIAAGLLPEDFMLKLDELGNIIAANNIPIEKLQSLLEQIKDGQMQFEDFEEYLSYISALLSTGNYDRKTTQAILNNIEAIQKSNVKSISAINTAIGSLKELDEERNDTLANIDANIAAIAESISIASSTEITADTTFNVETPDMITDKFPFSLPFDVYRVFNLLSADPVAPRWSVPIEMEGVFDYSVDVDLSEYDWIASIVRWLLYAVFVVGLILATNKLIGRG